MQSVSSKSFCHWLILYNRCKEHCKGIYLFYHVPFLFRADSEEQKAIPPLTLPPPSLWLAPSHLQLKHSVSGIHLLFHLVESEEI